MLSNIHPMVVHFPIALWMSAFLFEVGSLVFKRESWHRAAELVYVLAVCLAPLAVGTGLWEEQRHHLSHPVVTQHRNWAFMTLGLGLLSWPILTIMKKRDGRWYRWLFIIVLSAGAISVGAAGFFGGRLVYEYSVGIE